MSMTCSQEAQQTYGPHRPTVAELVDVLSKIPAHHEIQSVAINGQTGAIFVEFWHEGLTGINEFRPK